MEMPNLQVHTVAGSHPSAHIRESHPVGHAFFRIAALAQFPHLLHFWDYQLDSSLRIVKEGLCLLIIELCGFSGIHYTVGKANDLPRLGVLYSERVDPPKASIKQLLLHGNAIGQVSLSNRSHRFRWTSRALCGLRRL